MLDLVLAGREARRLALDDEEGRAVRGLGQDRVEVGDRAVGDELLDPVEPVVRDAAVRVGDPLGLRLEALHVGAGLGFGDAVGDDQSLVGDSRNPVRLLIVGAADSDRVGAERDGQHRRRQTQVDLRELAREAVDVLGAAAHPVVLCRQEDKVEPHAGPQHRPNDCLGADVLFVPLQPLVERSFAFGEFLERLDERGRGLRCRGG